MKRIILSLLLAFVAYFAIAQKDVDEYAAIDKKALEIPLSQTKTTRDIAGYMNEQFKTEEEKVRGIFIWVAANLEYDLDNMFAVNNNETREDKIKKALKTRRGICENYAAVFNDICRKCGLNSEIIVGYTRQEGFSDFLRHGWCAVQVDGKWRLFDPTWGSGYIMNNKFTPKINNEFYEADPQMLIKTHMPFDPVWQLSYYPVSNKEYTDKKTQLNNGKPYFSFPDTIKIFQGLTELQQWEAEARRLEQNGVSNMPVHDRLANLKSNIDVYYRNEEVHKQNRIVDRYNVAVDDFNEGVSALNVFINYRNKQFSPMKSDPAIQGMVDSAENKISRAENSLRSIRGGYDKIDAMMQPVQRSIDEARKVLDDQKEFLAEYFGKSKLGRKTMFRKYTWMGIPLN
jgi:hypothetical protein